MLVIFVFSSRRRHTRFSRDWSSDVCSSDLIEVRVSERFRPDQLAVHRDGEGKAGDVGRQLFAGDGVRAGAGGRPPWRDGRERRGLRNAGRLKEEESKTHALTPLGEQVSYAHERKSRDRKSVV